jgi:hypothetical protein
VTVGVSGFLDFAYRPVIQRSQAFGTETDPYRRFRAFENKVSKKIFGLVIESHTSFTERVLHDNFNGDELFVKIYNFVLKM